MISLVVPGSSDRMLTKARQLDVDELVFDLEDAVPAEHKPEALERVLAALLNDDFKALRLAVRCNPPDTPWAKRELEALSASERRPDSVVVPKVERADDLAEIPDGLRIQALIETAAGVLNLREIVAASETLDGLVLGYADLAASLGLTRAGAAQLDRW